MSQREVLQTNSTGVDEKNGPDQTVASLTREYGLLRDKTSMLTESVSDGHRLARNLTLGMLAREHARRAVPDLLQHLSMNVGLAWSDIARVVGVSVQSLRKWRQGSPATGENRLALARLVASIDALEEALIDDPGGWLEVPVAPGGSLRHIDLLTEDRVDLLLDLAQLRVSPEAVMEELDPGWRLHQPEHEVFRAEDGGLSIRIRTG